jgi:hydroxymethylpyrimidine pyrophosphatase-like HAD family hydrolase
MYNHSRFSGKKIFIHTGRYLTGTAAYFQRLGAEVYAPGNALKSPFFIRPVKRLSLKGFITDKGACSRPGEQKIDLFYTGSSKYDNPAFIQALSNTGVPGLIVPGIDPGLYGTFPGASFLDALITISGILIFYKESEHFCLKNSIRKNLVSFDELNRIKAAFIQAIYDNLLDNVQYRRLYTYNRKAWGSTLIRQRSAIRRSQNVSGPARSERILYKR